MKVVTTLLLALVLATASGCGDNTSAITSITTVFNSRIQEKGSAWRSIDVNKAGDVQVQLLSITQTDVVVNLAIGTIDGTQCVASQAIDTAANATASSPQITTSLAVGTYCVKVADIGNLTQTVDFSVYITQPY